MACAPRGRLAPRRRASAGLSLLEAAAVVGLTGAFLAVFVPVFARHLEANPFRRAASDLRALERGVAAYYLATHRAPDGMALQRCLPALPVSVDVARVATTAPERRALEALRAFPVPPRSRFVFSFASTPVGCAIPPRTPVTLVASADLDDDGKRSSIERRFHTDATRGLVQLAPLAAQAHTE